MRKLNNSKNRTAQSKVGLVAKQNTKKIDELIAFQLDVYCRKRYAVIVQAKQWAGLGFSSNFYSMLTWNEQSTSPEKGNPLMPFNANLFLGIMECYPS